MFRYLALVWDPVDAQAPSVATLLSRQLQRADSAWISSLLVPGLAVYCAGARPSANEMRPLHGAQGVILGQLFYALDDGFEVRRAALDEAETRHIVQTAGRHLVDRYWGRYVALLHDPVARCTRVLRDPSGTLPCFSLIHRRVRLYFSWAEDALGLVGAVPRVNWDYVRVHVPSLVIESRETGLENVQQVLAGECVTITSRETTSALYWLPHELAQVDVIEDETLAAQSLRRTTRACVRAWASCYKGVVLRLSGGLDSAIVLSCLQDPCVDAGVTCLNFFSAGADSDERTYARFAAGRASRELIEQERTSTIELTRLLDLPRTPKPSFYLEYLSNARLEAELAHTRSASAVFTGTGGDQLFYQIPTTAIATDYVRQFGFRWSLWSVAMAAARFAGTSVWAVLAEAFRDRHGGRLSAGTLDSSDSITLVDPEIIDAARCDHRFVNPMLRAALSQPPGKLLQIQSLVFPTEYYNPLGFPDDPEYVHPLLSQPLLELCMRIPTYVLVTGGRDRALARQAFGTDLPREIATRHSKGGLEENINAILEYNAGFVRELLLEGQLVRERILDRRRLEETLAGRLSTNGAFASELHTYIAIEAWLRSCVAPRQLAAA